MMGVASVRRVVPMAMAMLLAGPALAARVVVMTPSTINAALAALQPGDTLQLEGVFTTRLAIQNRDFGGVLVDGSRAVLEQGMNLRNVHNVNFAALNVGVAGQSTTNRFAINLDASTHVSFAQATVLGDRGTAGTGLRVVNSEFVTVRDSLFRGLLDGATFITTPNSLITRNRFEAGGSDGVKVVDSQRIILSGNSCTGFVIQPGVHPDCIQFWSRPDRPVQSDIYVINNSVIGEQQGFASFDPSGFSGTRFTFAGNFVAITRPHGISCFGCTDSRFIDNAIITLPDSSRLAGLHVPGGSGNLFENNLNFDLRGINSPLDQVLPSRIYTAVAPSIAGMVGSKHDDRSWETDGFAPIQTANNPVPEPATWLMLGLGFALVGRMMRRRPAHPVVLA